MNVSLSSCTLDQFVCGNGECLDLERRCDVSYDCKDESDEDICRTAIFREGYDKEISPPAPKGLNKTKVAIAMTIENVIEVNEIKNLFHLKLKLKYTWIDRRMCYHNLKASDDMNNLAQEAVSRMWIPQMTFENT